MNPCHMQVARKYHSEGRHSSLLQQNREAVNYIRLLWSQITEWGSACQQKSATELQLAVNGNGVDYVDSGSQT